VGTRTLLIPVGLADGGGGGRGGGGARRWGGRGGGWGGGMVPTSRRTTPAYVHFYIPAARHVSIAISDAPPSWIAGQPMDAPVRRTITTTGRRSIALGFVAHTPSNTRVRAATARSSFPLAIKSQPNSKFPPLILAPQGCEPEAARHRSTSPPSHGPGGTSPPRDPGLGPPKEIYEAKPR